MSVFVDCSYLIGVLTQSSGGVFLLEEQKKHLEDLLPALVEKAQLNSKTKEIIVGIGPGSFTGIRIAFATVKALAYAYKIPLYGISSLKWLLNSIIQYKKNMNSNFEGILLVRNAYQNEVFYSGYEKNIYFEKKSVLNQALLDEFNQSAREVIWDQSLYSFLKKNHFDSDRFSEKTLENWLYDVRTLIFDSVFKELRSQWIELSVLEAEPFYGKASSAEEKKKGHLL